MAQILLKNLRKTYDETEAVRGSTSTSTTTNSSFSSALPAAARPRRSA